MRYKTSIESNSCTSEIKFVAQAQFIDLDCNNIRLYLSYAKVVTYSLSLFNIEWVTGSVFDIRNSSFDIQINTVHHLK